MAPSPPSASSPSGTAGASQLSPAWRHASSSSCPKSYSASAGSAVGLRAVGCGQQRGLGVEAASMCGSPASEAMTALRPAVGHAGHLCGSWLHGACTPAAGGSCQWPPLTLFQERHSAALLLLEAAVGVGIVPARRTGRAWVRRSGREKQAGSRRDDLATSQRGKATQYKRKTVVVRQGGLPRMQPEPSIITSAHTLAAPRRPSPHVACCPAPLPTTAAGGGIRRWAATEPGAACTSSQQVAWRGGQ